MIDNTLDEMSLSHIVSYYSQIENVFEPRETCGPGSSFSAFGFLSFLMITFNLGKRNIWKDKSYIEKEW